MAIVHKDDIEPVHVNEVIADALMTMGEIQKSARQLTWMMAINLALTFGLLLMVCFYSH
jgi:hypothetical protein